MSLKIPPAYLGEAIQEAARNKSTCFALLIEFVIEHAGQLNIPAKYFGEALKNTITSDNPGGLCLLITHAKQLNITSCFAKLSLSSLAPRYNVLLLLIEHAEQLKIPLKYFSDALRKTVPFGNHNCVRLLLEHAKELNISSAVIGEAVIEAARRGKTDHLRHLLTHTKELNIPPKVFNDAALCALQNKHTGCFQRLVGTDKVDLNAQEDGTGMTATMFAVLNGNIICLQQLIEQSADLNIPNAYGKTAISLAVKEGNFRCMALLLSANVILSDEDIECLKAYTKYKDKLFGILTKEFLHRFGEEKSNDTLLMAYFKKDSALHQVFSVKMGARACSLDSGAFKKIRNVLLERGLIKRTAITSPSLSHSTHFKRDKDATKQPSDPYAGTDPIFKL